MPVTIHIPDDLLARLDRRASELRLSRSRYITQALERELAEETAWSARFLETLAAAAADAESHRAVDEMREHIRDRRTRKSAHRL